MKAFALAMSARGLILAVVLSSMPNWAGAATSAEALRTQGMSVVGFAKAPVGFVSFCTRQPADCMAPREVKSATLSTRSLSELDRINRDVNTRIRPVTDQELYGRAEYWAYPTDRGDCEDYVLLKRRLLISAGWPSSALLITVVRDQADEGHAVLTVVTDRGDYILDNQRETVLPWQMTSYDYVKRQSQTDPKAWVFVGPADTPTGVASTR